MTYHISRWRDGHVHSAQAFVRPYYSPTINVLSRDARGTLYRRRTRLMIDGVHRSRYMVLRLPHGLTYDERLWLDDRYCINDDVLRPVLRRLFQEPVPEVVRSEWEGACGVEGPDGEVCIAKVVQV